METAVHRSRREAPRVLLALGLWLAAAAFAVANATLSAAVIERRFGEYANHLYKSAAVIAFTAVLVAWYRRTVDASARFMQAMGFVWLGLTVAFEFLAGHYVFGNPWARLFADYRIWRGRVWSLVLLSQPLTWYLAGRRGR